jgi:hypothetical protein
MATLLDGSQAVRRVSKPERLGCSAVPGLSSKMTHGTNEGARSRRDGKADVVFLLEGA